MTRHIPRRLARLPIPLYHWGLGPAQLESYRTRHRHAARTLGRTLDIPELANQAPIPPDIGTRLPLLRIEAPPTSR